MIYGDERIPDHLVWGTHQENTQDMIAIGNHRNGRKTHCKYGHPFSGDNLVIRTSGARGCRE